MSGLLPKLVLEAVRHRSLTMASDTFGVIPLVMALVLLLRLDVGRIRGTTSAQRRMVVIVTVPLVVVALLTIAARLALLVS